MYRYVLKLMFLLPPERIHHLAFLAMQLVLEAQQKAQAPRLT